MMRARIIFAVPLLTILVAFTSCGLSGSGDGLDPGTYDGIYALGPEVSSFSPCNEQEQWWVIAGETNLEEQYEELTSDANAIIFARLQGDPGPDGEYGPNGDFNREFVVEEVEELRYATSEDCI